MDRDFLFTCSRNVYNMSRFTVAGSLWKERFVFFQESENQASRNVLYL